MKRILVGLDGSQRQSVVLDAARTLAEGLGAQLVLFRAVSLPVEYPASILAISPDAVEKVLEDAASEQLRAIGSELPAAIVAGVRVDLGSPWRSICEAAQKENVDLIVIGSHGYSGVDRLLGTTAAKVVNHADRSVLVVR